MMPMSSLDRITSYNVCYTKLLRSGDLAISISSNGQGVRGIARSMKEMAERLTGVVRDVQSYNFV